MFCLGSWLRCDFVFRDDLMEIINALKKRKVREEDQVDQHLKDYTFLVFRQ